ncbi:nucleotidyl transferase AbiEii/AbiGii toxin family protein [Syntrophus sp. (in: bacteria)]|uniref:nucleotidyl transferase AbiEii/AbiGii toxin family protein n=1 Tax=Syntrophus sp. (in: bacteria) TaxID=48412 RepID=UPI00345EEE68
MNVSLEYLRHCSNQTGYRIEPLEKVVRWGMAADIKRHPLLGVVLALKGGTCLTHFGPPKRLSVDLDYNYIGHLDRTDMLEARPVVEQAAVDLARAKVIVCNSQPTHSLDGSFISSTDLPSVRRIGSR